MLDQQAGAVVVGHLIRNQWVEDARFLTPLAAGVDYRLSLTLIGTAVTVTLNGTVLGSFSYNSAIADGGLGTISRTGTTSFDDLHVAIGAYVSNSPDSAPPVVTLPANVTRSNDAGKATAFVSDSTLGNATATDNVGVVSLVRSGVPAGNLFAIGVTTIMWTATDIFGNQTILTQYVTVLDAEKPALVVPGRRDAADRGHRLVDRDHATPSSAPPPRPTTRARSRSSARASRPATSSPPARRRSPTRRPTRPATSRPGRRRSR